MTGSSQMSVLILVIDDDVRVRVTIQRLLEAANFHIITAPSGQAGLKLFRAHEPALVITDIIMPEREGIETIVQMRRERPATKIIAISGGGRIVDPNFLEIAHQFGADGTLAKPFEPEQCSLLCERCSMKNRRPYCIIASNYDPTREYPCILWAGSGLHAISQSVVQNTGIWST
jgi:CheY-like chemotaxis protein